MKDNSGREKEQMKIEPAEPIPHPEIPPPPPGDKWVKRKRGWIEQLHYDHEKEISAEMDKSSEARAAHRWTRTKLRRSELWVFILGIALFLSTLGVAKLGLEAYKHDCETVETKE